MGHAGTLDPMATGVLVVCVGKATRLIQYVQRMSKEYRITMRLGFISETHDLESALQDVSQLGKESAPQFGSPCARDDPADRETLERCLKRYCGETLQVPPQHSALHVAGRRAYELARAGHVVPLKPRPIRIDKLVCNRFEYPDAELVLQCSSGTYVRSLVRDIGSDLGCGAVMTQLTRTRVGLFHIDRGLDPAALTKATVLEGLRPVADALQELPTIRTSTDSLEDIRHGRVVEANRCDQVLAASECTIVDQAGSVLAVGKFDLKGRYLHPHTVLIGD